MEYVRSVSNLSSSTFTASRPNSNLGTSTVVSAGFTYATVSILSNPIIEISCGTAMCRSSSAFITPSATGARYILTPADTDSRFSAD